jgi:hypothetical protein
MGCLEWNVSKRVATLQIGNLSYYYSIQDVVLLQRRRQQQSARSLFPFSVCLILFSRNREAAMKKVSVTKRELPKISRGLPNNSFPPPTQHQRGTCHYYVSEGAGMGYLEWHVSKRVATLQIGIYYYSRC